ncbi:MAG: M23 family metallopeptidase [Lachnospiraceae bacterium]|jgi:septal ring factor EnvC (AmiA/AmiB activator)|nr:M23 family metallopeptidase [Lachnospiraceae bacterium]
MMRRNRTGVRKERIIMLASSALVLTALTVTGVFVRSSHQKSNENNVLDFSAIENGVEESAENTLTGEDMGTLFTEVGTDDLDYDPFFQEANSANVENERNIGKTQDNSDKTEEEPAEKEADEQEGVTETSEKKKEQETKQKDSAEEGMFDESSETIKEMPEDTEALATTVQPILDFGDEDRLVWPIVGDILINYSMDKTIYFPTLQQYKYHPAIVIAATEGETITAAAEGRVTSVSYDRELGNMVVMDLGNGYELTYGQLDNITVSEGSYVTTGDIIGSVASPTKYYSMEGANIYFKLTRNGEPVNPMSRLNG